METLSRIRPVYAIAAGIVLLVGLAVFGATRGDGTESVVAGADSSEVVASVADRELTVGELDDLLPDGSNTVPSRIASVVETWMIAQALELELADRGFEITAEDLELAEQVVGDRDGNETELTQLTNTIAVSYVVGRWTDAEAAQLTEPDPPNYLCSSHLLVETEEEAQDALVRLDEGEDFAELAMELSIGPSGPSGGDLGCAVEGSFVFEFEEAAYAGEAGDVVGPVQTSFGWHLISITSVGPATVENHPTASPEALAQVAFDVQNGMVNTMILDLEGTAAANYRAESMVDASIGTLGEDSLDITPVG